MLDPNKGHGRCWLLPAVPEWIDPESTNFFVTICCQRRGTNQLCLPGVGNVIVSAARFYHEQRRWLLSLFLVVPDHVHMLVSFGRERGMIPTMCAWKRYLEPARHHLAEKLLRPSTAHGSLRATGSRLHLAKPGAGGLGADSGRVAVGVDAWLEAENLRTARRAAPTGQLGPATSGLFQSTVSKIKICPSPTNGPRMNSG